MAVKKSDLYSSLWASCDELRGGMDASQYKDYVLFMLFIKYISDKYAQDKVFAPPVTIPTGASFADMVALKNDKEIGDKINKQIIAPLVEANSRLASSDFPNFNDPNKLGDGNEMVQRLGNLISIFEKPELNFSNNKAENDDLLGDAYEYLMRHFATESGKSKGQFYTPSEVSRVIAQVIGISPDNSLAKTTAYDPTCGSGSLLLKVAAQAGKQITLEGQEKDVTTAGLARMNMILHDFPTANVQSGNTLAGPKFLNSDDTLRTYDYVVANPPFSDKTWNTGLQNPDPFQRFAWGEPPAKQGDYAYLLHIIRSMKPTGKAACILPHGVLFRGNAEAVIRRHLIKSGFLKGIIGLPANLFYGTGIPACILVLDKENARAREGIMMIDASKGFIKDGAKNRLREQDIHRIVDTFQKAQAVPRYARMVPMTEIVDARNDFNLNLPRYIDSSDPEDIQDIAGHLLGGLPQRDLDELVDYWQVMPNLRAALFEPLRDGYSQLKPELAQIKEHIMQHSEFSTFQKDIRATFQKWLDKNRPKLSDFAQGDSPKRLIHELSEDLLHIFQAAPLVSAYDIYQHLMDYWVQEMEGDAEQISGDGWVVTPVREVNKKGGKKDKGWTCELLPKHFIVARYFADKQAELDAKQAELEAKQAELTELVEEHSIEDGVFAELEKVNTKEVNALQKKLSEEGANSAKEELDVINRWKNLDTQTKSDKKKINTLEQELDQQAYDQYAKLSEDDRKSLIIDDKWLTEIQQRLDGELDRVSQRLTGRIRELAERYHKPLSELEQETDAWSEKVKAHLLAVVAK